MDGLTNVGLIVHVNYFLLEMECVSFSPNVFVQSETNFSQMNKNVIRCEREM
jgi:hypothetical protein